MKKILSILSILPCIAMADLVPADGVISSDFVQSGNQTGENAVIGKFLVNEGATLVVNGNLETNITEIVTDKGKTYADFQNNGTINVSEGASFYLNASTKSKGYSAGFTYITGNIIVNGTYISEIGNSSDYHIVAGTNKATNFTLNSTGLVKTVGGVGVGINNGYTSIILNASVTKDETNNWKTGLITDAITQRRNANGGKEITINADNAFCRNDGSASNIFLGNRGNLILNSTNASGNTDLGVVTFEYSSTLQLNLSRTPDTMSISGFAYKVRNVDAENYASTLIFENFANDLIKIDNFDETKLTDDGIYTFEVGANTITITITATNGDISSANGEWYVANGFLNNTAFGANVPEPAEWAMILGSLALGLAIYKRRK